MYDHAPHPIHPADATPPATPTPRTGSHRSGLLALLLVGALAAGLVALMALDGRWQADSADAAAAEAIVIDVADRVNSGGLLADGTNLVDAVGLQLATSLEEHNAPQATITTRVGDLESLGVTADAAYVVDVDGQLSCLLLDDARAHAYADGSNVTLSGQSALAPTSVDCAALLAD